MNAKKDIGFSSGKRQAKGYEIAQLLCKVIAYNIMVLIQEMHELGIAVDFAPQ
jgi:hypothetical protein